MSILPFPRKKSTLAISSISLWCLVKAHWSHFGHHRHHLQKFDFHQIYPHIIIYIYILYIHINTHIYILYILYIYIYYIYYTLYICTCICTRDQTSALKGRLGGKQTTPAQNSKILLWSMVRLKSTWLLGSYRKMDPMVVQGAMWPIRLFLPIGIHFFRDTDMIAKLRYLTKHWTDSPNIAKKGTVLPTRVYLVNIMHHFHFHHFLKHCPFKGGLAIVSQLWNNSTTMIKNTICSRFVAQKQPILA